LEAHHELWANLFAVGELTSARMQLERGFALYDPEKHKQHAFLYAGHDPGVCCGYHAATVMWLLGYPDQALRRTEGALALARKLSHPSSMANALFFAARVQQLRGDRDGAQARTEEGLAVVTEHGLTRWLAQATVMQGWLLVERGQEEAGLVEMLKCMAVERIRAVLGGVTWDMYCSALLAEAYGKAERIPDGIRVVDDALVTVHRTDCRYYEAELHRLKGKLLVSQTVAEEEQAASNFQRAIDVARGQSARSLELRAVMSMSRLWQKQGKKAEARQLLAEIYGWFSEGFDTADLRAAKALIEELA
jgi:predicted ATPase